MIFLPDGTSLRFDQLIEAARYGRTTYLRYRKDSAEHSVSIEDDDATVWAQVVRERKARRTQA